MVFLWFSKHQAGAPPPGHGGHGGHGGHLSWPPSSAKPKRPEADAARMLGAGAGGWGLEKNGHGSIPMKIQFLVG